MNEEKTPNSNQAVPFPFDDLEKRTTDYLGKVRLEAEQLARQTKEDIRILKQRTEAELQVRQEVLENTRMELLAFQTKLDLREQDLQKRTAQLEQAAFQESRDTGLEQGKKEGFLEGKRLAQEKFDEQVQQETTRLVDEKMKTLTPLMNRLVQELLDIRQSLLGYWHENILQIAAAIAFQTINRELPKIKDIPLDLLKEALVLSVGCTILKIRMNPSDCTVYKKELDALLQEMGLLTKIEIEADNRISAGGCVVETSMGTIDQQLESRLERIISELS